MIGGKFPNYSKTCETKLLRIRDFLTAKAALSNYTKFKSGELSSLHAAQNVRKNQSQFQSIV